MPVPEISVARPTVQNITLTKEYPGYLTSEKTVDLVGRVSGTFTDHRLRSRQPGTPGTSTFCHRTDSLSRQCAAGRSRTQHCPRQPGIRPKQLHTYAGSHEKRCCKPYTSAASTIQRGNFAGCSEQCGSSPEHSTHQSELLHRPCSFDGTVSRNLVDAGGYVGGSVQPVTLATIYKDDHLYTYFNVADNQWLSMLMQQGDSIPGK